MRHTQNTLGPAGGRAFRTQGLRALSVLLMGVLVVGVFASGCRVNFKEDNLIESDAPALQKSRYSFHVRPNYYVIEMELPQAKDAKTIEVRLRGKKVKLSGEMGNEVINPDTAVKEIRGTRTFQRYFVTEGDVDESRIQKALKGKTFYVVLPRQGKPLK